MGHFIKRSTEKYADHLGTTHFLHGDKPLPKMLLDDIEQVYYTHFAWNYLEEPMYLRIKY